MKYEYKAITLIANNNDLDDAETKRLNEMFSQGWEYVNSISQNVSSNGGSYSSGRRGSVIVILRKEKETLMLG